MIDVIFTLDYEIYGNGQGTLRELVYEPTERLREAFEHHNAKFVVFTEVAEFQQIQIWKSDEHITSVTRQIAELHQNGFEIALHLHPQWFKASFERGVWTLDYCEYNLCKLSRTRIVDIVRSSLDYLRGIIGQPSFTPLSFRAGNWLFQPTREIASVLSEEGIRIDSSVFKGGVQHLHSLDYRRAPKNKYYWPFRLDVNKPDSAGPMIEVPIYTEMVPFWRMATSKRLTMKRGAAPVKGELTSTPSRIRDHLRFRYPRKFDFCRMTLRELTSMMSGIIARDQDDPGTYRPIVAIGHSKDLQDLATVDFFLSFLRAKGISISTFSAIYPKLTHARSAAHLSRDTDAGYATHAAIN